MHIYGKRDFIYKQNKIKHKELKVFLFPVPKSSLLIVLEKMIHPHCGMKSCGQGPISDAVKDPGFSTFIHASSHGHKTWGQSALQAWTIDCSLSQPFPLGPCHVPGNLNAESPLMVPGLESAGWVSPSIILPVFTLNASQTMDTTGPEFMSFSNPPENIY